MPLEREVRKASERFYSALNSMVNGDAGPMEEAWSKKGSVTSLHPIGGREQGIENVLASFGNFAALAKGGSVRLEEQVLLVGEDMAVETGFEKGTVNLAGHTAMIDHRVTNVYRREGDGWRMVHHHTDMSPQMLEILRKLK